MTPYHHQRWPEISPYALQPSGEFVHPGAHHHPIPHHHTHHHPSYPSINGTHFADNHHRNVLLQNATLPPPVGELNNFTENHYATGEFTSTKVSQRSTSKNHSNFYIWTKLLTIAGAPSNLGSAVATSMNLTNNTSEPMGPETGAVYKSEPNDLMCFPNTINQTNDPFLSLLDEQLGAWSTNEDAFNVSDGKLFSVIHTYILYSIYCNKNLKKNLVLM